MMLHRTVYEAEPRTCTVRSLALPSGVQHLALHRAAGLRHVLWPSTRSKLSVSFLDGDAAQQKLVRDIASEWNEYMEGLELVFDNAPNAPIRVRFAPWASWSYVGTDACQVLDGPTLNFGWVRGGMDRVEAQQVILHEFGHALGLIHEHQQPMAGIPWDRAAVEAYYKAAPHSWTQREVDSNIFAVYSRDLVNATVYDPASIMQYPIPAGFTKGRLVVGWNSVLSAQDKQFIGRVYPAWTDKYR